MSKNVDVIVIGAGTAGLTALHRIRKVTNSFILIDHGPLGTTCARVGCMPSKILLQIAGDFGRRHTFEKQGIKNSKALRVDSAKTLKFVRTLRDRFVNSTLKDIKDIRSKFIFGTATFEGPNQIRVGKKLFTGKKIIIATGSSPIIPDEWRSLNDKLVTSDSIFELKKLPATLGLIGLGPLGLEIGQALARLGVKVSAFSKTDKIGILTDPILKKLAVSIFEKDMSLVVGKEIKISKNNNKLKIKVKNKTTEVELALISVGRKPNLSGLNLEKAGIKLNEKGIPRFNPETMKIENSSIFIAGDADARAPILHEASDDGYIAGVNSVAKKAEKHTRRIPLSIVFSEPNVVKVGQGFEDLKGKDFAVGEEDFKYGRAIIISGEGKIRIYGDKKTKKILGAEMIAPAGEHLGHLIATMIDQKMTVKEALNLPYYHPTIEESVKEALQDLSHKLLKSRLSP